MVFYCNWGVYHEAGTWFISPVHNKYLLEAAKRFEKITLLSKYVSSNDRGFAAIEKSINVVPLPSFSSYLGSIKSFLHIYKSIRNISKLKKNAFFYIRTPEPFSWLFSVFSRKDSKLLFHFASNPLEAIANKVDDPAPVRALKLLVYFPEFISTCIAARANIVSCNGKGLHSKLKRWIGENCIVLDESLVDEAMIAGGNSVKNINILKDKNIINIVYVGYIRAAKGLDYLIDAIPHVISKYNISVNIVGGGEYLDEIMLKIKSIRCERYVHFHGEVAFGDGLFDLYRKADIFILPSLSEGSPRVVLEAMALGLPVIATDVGNTKHLLEDGRGVCIKPRDSKEIANAVIDLIENDKKRLDYIEKGRRYSSKMTIANFFNEIKKISLV